MAPAAQTTPYDRYRLRERRLLIFVTGGRAKRLNFGIDQMNRHQGAHRKQLEKRRRRQRNRQIVPLPLRFYSQARAGLFEGLFYYKDLEWIKSCSVVS